MIINKIILVSILALVIVACSLTRHKAINLVSWDHDSISVKDKRLAVLPEKVIRVGKDHLRDALLKLSYRNIFMQQARLKGLDKSQAFLAAVLEKHNLILSRVMISKQVQPNIIVSEIEISNYFDENINDYTASANYDLYINYMDCVDEKECQSTMQELLINNDFKQLSKNNKISPSGYFAGVPLSKLNKNIQKVLKTLTVGSVSDPIKLANNGYIFIQIDKITPALAPQLSVFKKAVKQKLTKGKKDQLLLALEKSIVKDNPHLANKSREQIFASEAKKIGLDEDPLTASRLKRSYQILLADYGFYASDYFFDIDVNQLRKNLVLDPNILDQLSRFDLKLIKQQITNHSQFEIINTNKLLSEDNEAAIDKEILEVSQISKKDFLKEYHNLSIHPLTLNYNRWVGPIIVDKEVYWVKKIFQGLAKDDTVFIEDYKRYKRSTLGSHTSFMQQIGNDVNLKVNPVIYSKNWPNIAKRIVQAQKRK